MSELKGCDDRIFGYRNAMMEFASKVLSIEAIAPESGGKGEMAKADLILDLVSGWGFDKVERFYAPDDRVPDGRRPNYLLTIKGKDGSLPAIWVFSHIDVVPPGDLSKWTGDPWRMRIVGDRIIGRGVEDNGQGLIASLFAAKAMMDECIRPSRDVALKVLPEEPSRHGHALDRYECHF